MRQVKIRRGTVKLNKGASVVRPSTSGGALKMIDEPSAHLMSGHKKYCGSRIRTDDTNLEKLRDSLQKIEISSGSGVQKKKKYIRF